MIPSRVLRTLNLSSHTSRRRPSRVMEKLTGENLMKRRETRVISAFEQEMAVQCKGGANPDHGDVPCLFESS
jgi:hypothetical protein